MTDHFPTFLITKSITPDNIPTKHTIYKRQINENSIQQFRYLLINFVNWELVLQSRDADNAYELFLAQFCKQYNKAFPVKKFYINSKSILSPWITKGLLKSSRKKQKLYEKFLKK